MARKVGKRGDTLVEVMLAVGIFSMVAVAVVAVMSGGTSSSQTALETTLTREEIDTQADALRFIHRAYVADVKDDVQSPFGEIWRDITDKAVDVSFGSNPAVTQFAPNTCDDLYHGGQASTNTAFVINPQQVSEYVQAWETAHSNPASATPSTANVIVRGDGGNTKLKSASTYPHLIYTENESTQSLIDTSNATNSDNLYRAEGIYIIAVKDPGSTKIVDSEDFGNSAYYDFYIRTCWYGIGDQSPSTVSTVMRLYNPNINSPS